MFFVYIIRVFFSGQHIISNEPKWLDLPCENTSDRCNCNEYSNDRIWYTCEKWEGTNHVDMKKSNKKI